MAQLSREYLSNGADRSLHGFLHLSFAQLCHRHGSVVGAVVPRPRLIPIAGPLVGPPVPLADADLAEVGRSPTR
jgi:hypothetical protein